MKIKKYCILIFILSFSLGFSQSDTEVVQKDNINDKPIPFPLVSTTPKSKKCASFNYKYNYEYHECFNKEVKSFIQKNLSKDYIKKNRLKLKNAGGKLKISFIIDTKGSVYNVKIKPRGLAIESKEFYKNLENEFSIMFKQFKKTTPGKHLGQVVEVFYGSTLDLRIK